MLWLHKASFKNVILAKISSRINAEFSSSFLPKGMMYKVQIDPHEAPGLYADHYI